MRSSSFRYATCRRFRSAGCSPRRSSGCISTGSIARCRPTSTETSRAAMDLPLNTPSPRECARQIVDAFARYYAEFRAITRRAPQRFELYDHWVNQTIVALRLALRERAADRHLWQQIRGEFATQIEALPDPEFTKTFFSSISRKLFGIVGVAPDIEFVATDLDPLADIHSAVGTNTYLNHGSLALLFEDLLGDVRFRSRWRDLDNSIAHVAAEV